jgi:glycosyltransferase involved in cell wall biosynthesis
VEAGLVSCIVPAYNAERYLREALDSIFAQTYRPIEVIVVDDGSTDRTAAIVAEYGQPVVYLHQPNAGHGAARNRGVEVAHGEYLAFLDADDLWHPEKLTRQVARFEVRPELDMCVTHAQNFWAPDLAEEAARFEGSNYAGPLPGYVFPTLMVRRAFFDRVGPLDVTLRLGDDNDWFLRAYDHGATVELLPEILFKRRIHGSNNSFRTIDDATEAMLSVVKKTLDRRRRLKRRTAEGERAG